MTTVRPEPHCFRTLTGPDMQEAPREAIFIGLVAVPILAILVAAALIEKVWEKFRG